MFRTTLDFYAREYVLVATTQEEKERLRPYIEKAAKDRKPISKPEGYQPLDEKVIRKQRKNVAKTLDIMCDNLSPEEPIEGISCIKELDFRIRQEITNAGWMLTEKKGKVFILVYLP